MKELVEKIKDKYQESFCIRDCESCNQGGSCVFVMLNELEQELKDNNPKKMEFLDDYEEYICIGNTYTKAASMRYANRLRDKINEIIEWINNHE